MSSSSERNMTQSTRDYEWHSIYLIPFWISVLLSWVGYVEDTVTDLLSGRDRLHIRQNLGKLCENVKVAAEVLLEWDAGSVHLRV